MNLLNKMISPEEIRARMDRMDDYSAMGDYECTTCGNAIEMYLRVENGVIVKASSFSQGCGYCRACAATAAYLAVRESKLHIGVGYRNDAGEYELVAVESESWVEAAGLPFDELGKD